MCECWEFLFKFEKEKKINSQLPFSGQSASEYFTSLLWPAECRAPQPQPAQVLCACGEREGGSVDSGWGGIPETQVAEDHGVRICCWLSTIPFLFPVRYLFGFPLLWFARSPSLVKNLPSSLGYGTALNASLQVQTQTPQSLFEAQTTWLDLPTKWQNECGFWEK